MSLDWTQDVYVESFISNVLVSGKVLALNNDCLSSMRVVNFINHNVVLALSLHPCSFQGPIGWVNLSDGIVDMVGPW